MLHWRDQPNITEATADAGRRLGVIKRIKWQEFIIKNHVVANYFCKDALISSFLLFGRY